MVPKGHYTTLWHQTIYDVNAVFLNEIVLEFSHFMWLFFCKRK